MQKLKAIITRRVHDVGYRILLVNQALSMGVNNFNTFNTFINGTQAVITLIEADEEGIEEFKKFATTFIPKESVVENISFEEYKNTIPPIERVMQAFQMEQWGKGIPILLKMLEKEDKMLEKQDITIHILERVSEDTYNVKSNLSDMNSTLSRIEVDVRDTKLSLSSYIEEKFRRR